MLCLLLEGVPQGFNIGIIQFMDNFHAQYYIKIK